ncbi:MAG: glycerol dehydrogenase [Aerococcus sp.]|nr:glycerol dehydrogenase [Aerococcus sp.]
MEKVFSSPSHYVQGKNILLTGAKYFEALGHTPLLITDDDVWEIIGEKFVKSLSDAGLDIQRESFNGEASDHEIQRIKQVAEDHQADFIIGLGGGKTSDTAKAVADELALPVAIAPTLASTDAPTSALSVIYTDEGNFEKYRFYDKNPDLVIVDTQVVAQAPAKFLAFGIGDASATYVEARAVAEGYNKNMLGGASPLAAQVIAKQCMETIFKYGIQAVAANEAHVVTSALEAVVEANTLMSGLGFESSGLAAAHAIHDGFTALDGPVHRKGHGEKVAYGVLTELFLENRDKAEIDQYITFYKALHLPTTLEELGLGAASYEDLLKVGQQATIDAETMTEMPFDVTAEDVAEALLAVNQYVTTHYGH